MTLGNTGILSDAGIEKWEQSTALVVEREIIKLLEDDIVTLKVIVTLKMQSNDPSFQTSPTMPPSPVNRRSRENQEIEFWNRRRLNEIGAGFKNLHILFDVNILIRSLKKEHDVDSFIDGPFNSIADQQYYVLELRESGAKAFENTLTVGVILPPDPAVLGAEKYPKGSTSMNAGLVAGFALFGVGLIGLTVFLLILQRKRRHRRVQATLKAQAAVAAGAAAAKANGVNPRSRKYMSPMNHEFGGVADDVSTIGDPLPPGMARDMIHDDPTIAGNVSLPWDVQQDIHGNTSLRSIDDTSSNLVSKDDCTLENQYNAVAQFEVAVPAGMLGLVLESSVEDGVPIVHAIKPTSPLADLVKIGDALIKVDGIDVAYRHASDVSRLIAKRKDKPIRNFLFSRSPKPQRKPLAPPQEVDEDDSQTVDLDQVSRHIEVQADLLERSFDSMSDNGNDMVMETTQVKMVREEKDRVTSLDGHIQRALNKSCETKSKTPTNETERTGGSGINFDDALMNFDNLSI